MCKHGPMKGIDPNDPEVLPGLRRSQCGTVDIPKLFDGPLPFEAFRLSPNWGANRYDVFLTMMLCASGERRINAKHGGLLDEAAETVVRLSYSELQPIYRERGVVLYALSSLKCAANELACEMATDPQLKTEAVEMLRDYREFVTQQAEYVELDEIFLCYPAQQSPLETMNMWRDYTDVILSKSRNKTAFALRRFLSTCIRVRDAVFDANS